MFWSLRFTDELLQSHFKFLFLLFVTLIIFEYYLNVFIIIIRTLLQWLLSVLTNEAFVFNQKYKNKTQIKTLSLSFHILRLSHKAGQLWSIPAAVHQYLAQTGN